MMKRIIFIAALILGIHYVSSAQEFEHIAVEDIDHGAWRFTLKADTTLHLLGQEERGCVPSKNADGIRKQIEKKRPVFAGRNQGKSEDALDGHYVQINSSR